MGSFISGIAGIGLAILMAGPAAHAAEPLRRSYPGTLRVEVDASDTVHRILRVRERIPVVAGPLALAYPQWLPGKHAPRGQIDKLAGLRFRAADREVEWTRDPLDVYTFHLDVPAGASELVAEFEFLAPQDRTQGRIVVTPAMINVQWEAVSLYPAGVAARGVTIEAELRLPDGWHYATALERADGTAATTAPAGGVVRFAPVTYDTFVDSPLYAGRHFRQVELQSGARPVRLNLFADDAPSLEAKPEQLKPHADLVVQARRLFGAQPYDHYDFLLALSDELGGIGLEHHRSSENAVDPAYFTAWDRQVSERSLLPHEFTHSWNGKFRRPAGLATANFNTPMDGELLWVYEGQTQYWGQVLAARSGLWSMEQARDALAIVASTYTANRPGFAWRDVRDTTRDPVIAARRPLPYRSWQMSEDYYSAGQLAWLAVDAKLRELTGERRSLDDFARAFFGTGDGRWDVEPYDFDDVVAALDRIARHDWAAFLRARIDANAAPLDGLAASGWRLAYAETPSAFQRAMEQDRKSLDRSASIGLVVGSKDGRILDVRWDGPAFKAGLAASGTLVAVDGRAFTPERLATAIAGSKTSSAPIELLVKDGDRYRTIRVDYHGGARYPRLERIPGTPDRLGSILAPRTR